MEYLFDAWPRLAKKLKRAKHTLFLFDFDGTLAPIVRSPKQARLDTETRGLLKDLSMKRGCEVGVISGRSLRELQRQIGLTRLVYAGNHGLEIKARDFSFVHPVAEKSMPHIQRVSEDLTRRLSAMPGLRVENKALTLSVHYRQLDKAHRWRFRSFIQKDMRTLCRLNGLAITKGKKVIDVRPTVAWDKGKTALMLRAKLRPSRQSWFIGDDVTDEDVFRKLRSPDVTVRIEPKRSSHAAYYLKSQAEVKTLLRRLMTP